jgi:hypothetical protein
MSKLTDLLAIAVAAARLYAADPSDLNKYALQQAEEAVRLQQIVEKQEQSS